MTKKVDERILVTIIPTSKASLPIGTLKQILGDKQTKLGNNGLIKLLNKYGL
jgi:predicted RNA binding protein YcfA (HicA-like mRNA interferase family)